MRRRDGERQARVRRVGGPCVRDLERMRGRRHVREVVPRSIRVSVALGELREKLGDRNGAIAAFGRDYRRLRPNIVIGGVEGLGERDWPGGCLRVGKVLIGVQDLRLRCIMTSFDPDTLVQDKEITRDIYRRFEGKLALNRFVIEAGEISVGDEVKLIRGRACAKSAAE